VRLVKASLVSLPPRAVHRLPSERHSGSPKGQAGGESDRLDQQELACRVRQHGEHAVSVLDDRTGQEDAERDHALSEQRDPDQMGTGSRPQEMLQ
jgi:hypothetical protein